MKIWLFWVKLILKLLNKKREYKLGTNTRFINYATWDFEWIQILIAYIQFWIQIEKGYKILIFFIKNKKKYKTNFFFFCKKPKKQFYWIFLGKRFEIYPNFDRNCCNNTELWEGPFTPLHYLIVYFKGIYVPTWTHYYL